MVVIGQCFIVLESNAQVVFSGGGTFQIDSEITDNVLVSSSSGLTTVNVVAGGRITDYMRAKDNGRINVLGGEVDGVLYATSGPVTVSGGILKSRLNSHDHVEVSGGIIQGVFETYLDNTAIVSGGELQNGVQIYGESYGNISGGQIERVYARDDSSVDVTGGLFTYGPFATNNAVLDITGGLFGDTIDVRYNAVITIHGTGFNYPYGEIPDTTGTLTGTLNSGEAINNNFSISHYGSGYDGAAIVLVPEPMPPIADAGFDQIVTDSDNNGTEQVTLDGSGSSDSYGTIVSYVWTDSLGDTIPDGVNPTASLSVGVHTITLTVTDDEGLTDTDTVTIIVEQLPVADAGSDQFIVDIGDNGNEDVVLDGTGSYDADGTIVSWVWTDDLGDTIPDGETPTATLTWGVHTILLTVTDDDGLTDTDTVTITVEPTLHTLTVTVEPNDLGFDITDPNVGDNSFDTGSTVNLTATNFIDCPDVYQFDRWEGDVADPNSANTTVVMDSDKTVTAVFTATRVCGDECHPYPAMDFNTDCIVDFNDFSQFAFEWLVCTKPECD